MHMFSYFLPSPLHSERIRYCDGVMLCMCVHRISLGGEGNALYPVLSSVKIAFVHVVTKVILHAVFVPCCVCAAVRVVRDSSSGQFVKISSTRVERTTTASSINASVIDVKRVVTSAVCRLE